MHAEPFFFCQNLEPHDTYLWLVDSGASRTVVSEHALQVYKVLRVRQLEKPIQFRTASGEQVGIDRECMLEVFFPTYIEFEDHDKSKMIRYEVRSVIGPVEHNLLSVHSLTRMGATFQFGPESSSIQVYDIRRIDCNIWANVPWIRAHRRKGRGSSGSSSRDIEMEHSLTQETWSDSSPSQQGSKSPISPDTSFRMSELPSKPRSPKPHMPRTNHVKVLKFSDKPEVHEFEPNPRISSVQEVSSHASASTERAHEDHPLPVSGELADGDSINPEPKAPAHYQQLSKKAETELSLHRRRGHIPFDNRCVHVSEADP